MDLARARTAGCSRLLTELPAGEREEHLVWRNASDAGEQFLKCHSKLDSVKLQV